ncbi:hypothetical protein [Mucilaginibacter frigoritolerans]|nr:hypothetical protein [Mucilaginibacter frigoritolerans]
MDKLIIIVKASFAGLIGYGSVYQCQVLKTVKGNINESNITITILQNDTVNQSFLSSHTGLQFEMGLKIKAHNEPYNLMPISGFVDDNKTSWEIEYLKDH